jgi:hypothetical protein
MQPFIPLFLFSSQPGQRRQRIRDERGPYPESPEFKNGLAPMEKHCRNFFSLFSYPLFKRTVTVILASLRK